LRIRCGSTFVSFRASALRLLVTRTGSEQDGGSQDYVARGSQATLSRHKSPFSRIDVRSWEY
jgi:hypothetical protein